MKKVNVFLAGVFFLLFSFVADAQTKTGADFFPGKWNLLVAGTPNGDIKMIVTLERKDGNLGGTIEIVDYENIKISKTDEKESSVTLFFNAGDHDLFILLEKKDENHVVGNEMDLFDVKGERIGKTDSVNANIQAQPPVTGEAYFILFTAQGMDIPINITKKDDKNITGNVMGMFDIVGWR